MFWAKILYSHSTSLYKWVLEKLMIVVNGLNPIQEGVEIPLVTSSYRNQDKLWPDGQLGLHELRVNLHLFLLSF